MAAKAKVDVEGVYNLRRGLKRMGDDLEDLKDVNQAVAGLVAQVATATAPRRTGTLAGTVRGNRAASKAVITAGRASVPYAVFVHWGTASMSRQPWVSEAASDTEPRWLALYQDGMQKAADKVRGA